jgi:hypothetical protein
MSLRLAPLTESASGVPRPHVTVWCFEPLPIAQSVHEMP